MTILFSLFFFVTPLVFTPVENKEYIDWQKNRQLTWDDFKAPVNKNSSAAASTATHISANFSKKNNVVSFTIACQFSKHESWAVSKTPYILSHEQGHFDIAEIYTRKLYKALTHHVKTFPGNINGLDIIYQNIMDQKDSFQKLYDLETRHSIDKIKQEEWLQKIARTLNELEEFSNYNQNNP
jgi:hypothetical protein